MTSPGQTAWAPLLADVAAGRVDYSTAAKSIAAKSMPGTSGTHNLRESGSDRDHLWDELFEVVQNADMEDEAALKNLVNLTVALAKQRNTTDHGGGHSRTQASGHASWKEMPGFVDRSRLIWRDRSNKISSDESSRGDAIQQYTNSVSFIALLVATGEPQFRACRLQILWSFRTLESLTIDARNQAFLDLDVDIPTIARILAVFDSGDNGGDTSGKNEISRWTDQYPPPNDNHGGDSGEGGPLWTGVPGFDPDRYALWKSRLQQIRHQDNIDVFIKSMAGQATSMM